MNTNGLKKVIDIAMIVGALSGSAYAAPQYKLGVVLVVDQFRADYLMRFKNRFAKTKGGVGGYSFLMERGAYFPLADHGIFQNMTAPGHAAILSGTYPYRHHIPLNTWFDREHERLEYCVGDEKSLLVGSDGVMKNSAGVSPKNFNANTVGDELKNVDRASRVVSISLKDRAAILLGGKRSDYSIWFDEKSCQWVSSQYYLKELPEFLKAQNKMVLKQKGEAFSFGTFKNIEKCSKESLQTPWGINETFQLALRAVDELKLGRGKDTDLLTLSLSSHDYLGHHFGPNHENMETMTIAEDQAIANFLLTLSKKLPGGMDDLFLVFTGDHGMPPNTAENITESAVPQITEEALTQALGSPHGGKWVSSFVEFQLYFNPAALKAAGITSSQAVKVVRERLMKERYVDEVLSRDDIMRDRKVPAGELGVVLDRSLSENSGDMLVVLKPFFYGSRDPVSHMTHYSYDRYVPLIFYGKGFKPGLYRQIVHTVDIAPTLSSVLHLLPPAQSEGRILTEILQ